jgi:CRP/FNR family transcriptional regulator, cyclic AMP receptor protein
MPPSFSNLTEPSALAQRNKSAANAAPESAPESPFPQLPEALRLLAQRGELKRYRKGHRLIEEGELGDTLFIILAGRVRVYGSSDSAGSSSNNGAAEREITYGTYGVGDYFGEMSLDGGPRSASVETLEATECAVITRHTLKAHIAEHPEFAFDLLAKVIRRARAATLSTKQLALNDVYGRLVLLLNSLAVPQADDTRLITERLTHQEMANRLGCSREMVSRLMKDLERGGYLRVELGGMVLVKRLPVRW